MKTKVIVVAVLIGLLALLSFSFISGQQRMAGFRTRIQRGMSIDELLRFAGKPARILQRGEPLKAKRPFPLPPQEEYTAVYVFQKDGTPYFNAYVFIDERRSVVSSCCVENLWW